MARKRSISTNLFASPDFFELSNNTIRLILIGIILDADDEGRGCAHPRLLARKLDQQPEDIEQALMELAAHGILLCYEIAGRTYYWLCHWEKYQTLSKPTPSNYPPPPRQMTEEETTEQREQPSDNPVTRSNDERRSDENKHACSSTQVASILHLPESQELHEIIQEFTNVPTLSVLGEAIEARAWIDDTHRNRRQQAMTPAFFRRWLRRSQRSEEAISHKETRETPAVVSQPVHEPDQYEVYVNTLIEKYNGPEALQWVS